LDVALAALKVSHLSFFRLRASHSFVPHYSYVQAGKHVMCEKPLGVNAAEAQKLAEAAQATSLVHMTAFTYRFAPSMQFLKKLISEGELGDIRHFRSQR
jgi:predicted dehydrogenase